MTEGGLADDARRYFGSFLAGYDDPSDVITALIFAAVTLSIALYARR